MSTAAARLSSAAQLRSIREIASEPWRFAALMLLLALCIGNVYRAATQSITHDEAVTWQWFLNGPFSLVFGSPEGNHHPLHTLLCKITVTVFGLSELSLRLPSLAGGFLYFYAVWRISGLLFGRGYLFLLSVALLSLNPFLLDYLSCARGYSAGLAFLLFAIYYLVEHFSSTGDPPQRNGSVRPLNRAGVALGLAIASNVITIFPAGALTAVFLSIVLIEGILSRRIHAEETVPADRPQRSRKERRRKHQDTASMLSPTARLWHAIVQFVIPTIVVSGLIVLLPRRLVYLEVGYAGPPSLRAILEGIVRPSFLHSQDHLGLGAWLPTELAIRLMTDVIVPACLLALVVFTARIVLRWVRLGTLDAVPILDRFLLLLGGMLPVVLVMIISSRYILHVPYPEQRTVLYGIPLLGLVCLSFVKELYESRQGQIFAVILAAFLVLCVVQFATQFNTRYYAEWAYCAGTKDMVAVLRDRHASKPAGKIRLGVTWLLEPGVNFYRSLWHLDWIQPVYRESPDGDFDYYLLLWGDVSLVQRRGLTVLFNDKLSGAVLAQRTGLM